MFKLKKKNWKKIILHLDMALLLLSEVQIGYKAQAKLAHNRDHQTSKQFPEHWNNITKNQMK